MCRIRNEDDLFEAVEQYGILPFWSETEFSGWSLCEVNFMKYWSLREKLINSKKVAYGKFVNKKATFVSLEVFPYLCSLRRDGYDFDSLCDEGKAPRREIDIMRAVGDGLVPSYALGKSLEMKGFDTAVTSLQNKTYLALHFKKSAMGTALLATPETLFGYDYVRSRYSLSPAECAAAIADKAKLGLSKLAPKVADKVLLPAV